MLELSFVEGTGRGEAGLLPDRIGGALRTIARCVRGMSAVAIARLGPDGRVLHANGGFRALVGERAAELSADAIGRAFIHPTLDQLLARASAALPGRVAFAGVLNLVDEAGTVRSLQATVVREGGSVLIVGERDVTGLERLSGTLLALNEELMRRGRELERLNRTLLEREAELARLAATDQLTDLPNRRTLLAQLRSELALAEERGRPLSVALADIDRFKAINDLHGHDAGDAAIVLAARALRDGLRGSDLVGRWGGEEFLLVLPGTPIEEALSVVERLRVAVRESAGVRSFVRPFTLSFGVGEAEPGDDAAELVRRTDLALYAAKGAGRDRVARAGRRGEAGGGPRRAGDAPLATAAA